jgi:type IV pilus assembly protein PilA
MSLAVAASLALFSGCSKSETPAAPATPPPPAVNMAPDNGLSAPVKAISSHLEFGGEFYAIMDTKGEMEKFGNMVADMAAPHMTEIMDSIGGPPIGDLHPLFKELGLYNIDGGGMSTWKETNAPFYHNRMFLYTPGGRTGLLKVLGGAPGPFVTPDLAPADADVAYEVTLDLKSLAELLLNYAKEIGGPALAQQLSDGLKQPPIPGSTLTGQWLIDHLDTRVTLILRADPTKMVEVMPGQKLPMVDALIALDGFADLFDQIQPLLAGGPGFKFDTKNGMKTLTVDQPMPDPISDYKPMLISDPKSKRLYLVSRESFADQTVFGQGPRLSTADDFKAATAGLPTAGNALSYISKKGAPTFVDYYKLILSNIPVESRDKIVGMIFGSMVGAPHGVACTQVNLADGVLCQSTTTQSIKDSLLVMPVMMMGMGAAATLPTAGPAQPQAGNPAIQNNLRNIATAAQQYLLDKNATEVRYQDLISGATPYMKPVNSIQGESYDSVVVRTSTTRISVTTASGQVVSFDL